MLYDTSRRQVSATSARICSRANLLQPRSRHPRGLDDCAGARGRMGSRRPRRSSAQSTEQLVAPSLSAPVQSSGIAKHSEFKSCSGSGDRCTLRYQPPRRNGPRRRANRARFTGSGRQLRRANASSAAVCRNAWFREEPLPFWSRSAGHFWRRTEADSDRWQGQFQGQSWGHCGPRNLRCRIYLAFPRGEVAERLKAAVC